MKTISCQLKEIFTFILLGYSVFSWAQTSKDTPELKWLTDMKQAAEVSTTSGKPIFAFFTGSDWCGWCHKLQRDVFAKPEFVNWAKQNVVLVELDFPRSKKLPEATVKQNAELQQVFKVGGYPTIWLFTLLEEKETKKFQIKALGSLGYPGDAIAGKEQNRFIDNANKLLTSTN